MPATPPGDERRLDQAGEVLAGRAGDALSARAVERDREVVGGLQRQSGLPVTIRSTPPDDRSDGVSAGPSGFAPATGLPVRTTASRDLPAAQASGRISSAISSRAKTGVPRRGRSISSAAAQTTLRGR